MLFRELPPEESYEKLDDLAFGVGLVVARFGLGRALRGLEHERLE
jgi:hypothetical protein